MTIEKIDKKKCTGCKTCFDVCPMDVIGMNRKTRTAFIRYPEDCQVCNLCVVFCPEDAVTINKYKNWPIMTAWG